MPTRREFLSRAVAGAAALAVVGCSEEPEKESVEGLLPIKYGDARSQLAELQLPNEFGPHPVVVVIHGGWWRTGWDRRGTRFLARDLVSQGYATWNLEYRLVGEVGGGWPGTFEDVATGIDTLAEKAEIHNLDLERVVFLGHSAGGHLALWASARQHLGAGQVGADPRVLPQSVVALAPVTDLVTAAQANLGDGAVQALLGGPPEEHPEVYRSTSPIDMLPMDTPQVLYHAVHDPVVPVDQSRRYEDFAGRSGTLVELVEFTDDDHFAAILPDNDIWARVRAQMPSYLDGRVQDVAQAAGGS